MAKAPGVTAPRVVPAYEPARYDEAVLAAIKAVNAGVASADQQQLALRWIVEQACGTYDQPFRPGHDGQTEFACGRMFAGQQIVKMLKLVPVSKESKA